MRSPIVTPLFLALALTLTPTALAGFGTEAEPGCEADQPWVGYRTTDPARNAYEAEGSPGGLRLCEGEHWDGEDSVSAAPGTCSGSVSPDAQDLHASFCLGPDPNAAPGDDPVTPMGLRVSARDGQAYAAANAAFVARVAVYADEGTTAVYARDNTPGNMLATIVSCCSITQPVPQESDCDQATYQEGAYAGDRRCHRENTAITLEHALLA